MTVYRVPLVTVGTTQSSGTTLYYPVANGPAASSGTVVSSESTRAIKYYTSGFFQGLRISVTTNSGIGGGSLTVRKDAVSTALTVPIPSGLTGLFENTSTVLTITPGESYTFELINSSTLSISFDSIAVSLLSANGYNKIASVVATNFTTASATRYLEPVGLQGYNTSENIISRHTTPNSLTIKNFQCYIATNSRSTSSSYTVRKNASDTAMTISTTASTAGLYEDTTNTISMAAGDDFSISLVSGSGAGNFVLGIISFELHPTTAGEIPIMTGYSGSGQSSGIRYTNLVAGELGSASTTESTRTTTLYGSGTISNMYYGNLTNAATGNTTITARKNGVDQSLVVVFPATTTGVIPDTTHSFSFVSDDYVSLKTVRTSGSGSFAHGWVSCVLTADSEADPGGGGGFIGQSFYYRMLGNSGSGMNV